MEPRLARRLDSEEHAVVRLRVADLSTGTWRVRNLAPKVALRVGNLTSEFET